MKMNKGKSADDRLPKFFKVYLPDESGDDLEIPISFNSFLPKPFPKTVTVRSISGSFWKLAFRKCCGDVERFVVVNGWKRIVKDEDLKGGDFLEFEFDGSQLFNFCIYERDTMCKRMRSCFSEQSEEINVESDSEEETQASDDVLALDDDEDEDDGDVALEDEDNDGDESDDVVVDDDASEDDDDNEAVNLGADAARDLLDDRENPSFTVRLNPKKKSQMLIPARVINDYGLHFPESITIVDPLVKKFGTLEKQIKIQTNGSVFVKGFGSIIRRNKVKTTDTMICEIKKTGDNNLVQTLKIHIISG